MSSNRENSTGSSSSSSSSNPLKKIASKVNAVLEEERNSNSSNASTRTSNTSSSSNNHRLDLWQARDWTHRRGDEIRLNLHSMPLPESSPGRRSHPCEKCNRPCQCIHDNVLCWKCKGAFCAFCIVGPNPNSLMTIKMETVLKDGFGKCPACEEPLRSIGLIDVFRTVMENLSEEGAQLVDNRMVAVSNENSRGDDWASKQGQSLVQEAEQALQRARSFRDANNDKNKKKKNKAAAIDEYTHAINAITYFASMTQGENLVLRPHDLLLIAHCERADLEGNNKLADAILAAYPRASVRSEHEQEGQFHVSRAGFRSLFYPLPACLLVGSPPSPSFGLLRFDLRTDSKDHAFETSSANKQFLLSEGMDERLVMKDIHPHSEGTDNTFSNLNGSWKGVQSHIMLLSKQLDLPSMQVDQKNLSIAQFIQFVRVFPSATAAAEYTRIIFETKGIGEEKPTVSAQPQPSLAKKIKNKTKRLLAEASSASAAARPREEDAIELRQVHAIQGRLVLSVTSVVAAVGNVSTKIFICGTGGDQPVCTLVARALVYLHHRLENCRVKQESNRGTGGGGGAEEASTNKIIQPCADLSLCAFCGQVSAQLKTCTRCKSAKYCNADCQGKHWTTKGPNSHRTLCKEVCSGRAQA